jgi:hypothetical protein
MEEITRFFEQLFRTIISYISSTINGIIYNLMNSAERKVRDNVNEQIHRRTKPEKKDDED